MAVKHDKANDIVTLGATNDEIEDEQFSIQGVLFVGTASPGANTIEDGNGNVIAAFTTTAEVLTGYVPVYRTVRGLKALAIATAHNAYVYLKKGN